MPLRIVIFTTAGLSASNDVLFRRLCADPELEVAAIICDGYPWRTQTLGQRVRKHGLGYLPFKLRKAFGTWWRHKLWAWFDREFPPVRPRPSFERLAAETGAPLHHTPDLHAPATLDFIRTLNADLGLICGGRIIRECVLSLPRLGTLNIHKRKVPDYRGGGAIGYWELLNGEPVIGVTIHYAVARVDEGAVLGQIEIPVEPYDNLNSLLIKATVQGNNLYHDVVRQIARGQATGTPQDTTRGRTYRGAGDYAETRLQWAIQQREAAAFRRLGRGSDYYTRPALWLKLLLALPALRRARRELLAAGQAPIIVFFFHRVANDAATPGTLPLDAFTAMIDRLRRHVPIIALEEAERRLASGHNRELAAVLTFDDGYAADLATSIPWLRYHGIPATWFVSVGHTLDGTAYPHDQRRGITTARPMTPEELQSLPDATLSVGSHCWHHEDCGKLAGDGLQLAIVHSREKLEALLGRPVRSFAFPKGIKGVNITRPAWELAAQTYPIVCSAYSGYNFPAEAPVAGARHIKRWGNGYSPESLIPVLLGFTGLGAWRRGNLWTRHTAHEPPW